MRTRPRYIIGLTGLPSSGKGEVAQALLRLVRSRGGRGACLSFSDEIKEEARRRGVAEERFDRDLLSQIGIEMRQAEGPGVLAARIAHKINAWPRPRPEVFVVEALRHVGEIDALREAFGDRFVLIAVESEPRTIARRLIARHRPDESPDALQSEEHAIWLLEKELNGRLSDLGPNVGQCAARADVHLPNNGSLEELSAAVARLYQSIAGPDAPPAAASGSAI